MYLNKFSYQCHIGPLSDLMINILLTASNKTKIEFTFTMMCGLFHIVKYKTYEMIHIRWHLLELFGCYLNSKWICRLHEHWHTHVSLDCIHSFLKICTLVILLHGVFHRCAKDVFHLGRGVGSQYKPRERGGIGQRF